MKSEYLLEMKNIKKHFGGIKALDGVELHLKRGEVLALVGENGAGKSTLMKILGGAYAMDEGELYINGEKVKITNPTQSLHHGIAVIFQEQSLVDCLSVADNIMLGRIPNKIGAIKNKELMESAIDAMERVGCTFEPHRMIKDLTVAQRQFVEIAKAISMNAEIIVFDEPTAVLTIPETEILFNLVHKLKKNGISMIYISHRLEELYEIADRCTVLKDGCFVGSRDMKDTNKNMLVKLMTGRQIENIFPEKKNKIGDTLLQIKNFNCPGVFSDITFTLKAGEIVGLGGLVGSGRTEVARAVFGIDSCSEGELVIGDRTVQIKSPGEALRNGIIYITEDRKGDGLVLGMSVAENITISTLKNCSKLGVINKNQEAGVVSRYMSRLNVKCSDSAQAVNELSGGNQQKVVISRALLSNAKIIIIDEPTRGVDVGAKTEIYKIIHDMASQGAAILMISSELMELIGMSDRIIVMHEGRISEEFQGSEATEEKILLAATGGE